MRGGFFTFLLQWTMVYRSIFRKLQKVSILVLIKDHDAKSHHMDYSRSPIVSSLPDCVGVL